MCCLLVSSAIFAQKDTICITKTNGVLKVVSKDSNGNISSSQTTINNGNIGSINIFQNGTKIVIKGNKLFINDKFEAALDEKFKSKTIELPKNTKSKKEVIINEDGGTIIIEN